MLAIWSGATYQFTPPEWLYGASELPIVIANKSDGTAVFLRYPTYRLVVLATALVIGAALWLFINRTRAGMMIRAGVDDRQMLAATVVNVPALFAIVFAIGAGLAGFAGVVGGTALSIAPGEDVRYLSWPRLSSSSSAAWAACRCRHRCAPHRARRAVRACLFPDLRRGLDLHPHGAALAFRPQGIMGRPA